MSTASAGGSPAYVAAHRIALLHRRLPFGEALCLTTLVLEYTGGPVVPGGAGPITVDHCLKLFERGFVTMTTEMISHVPALARLTLSSSILEELVGTGAVIQESETERRPQQPKYYVEVTQTGLDLVVDALEPSGS